MRPTSTDVARRAHVSRATVSYVMNEVDGQSIPESTREAVLRAAAELGYRPNPAARALSAGRSSVIVFVAPHAHLNELTLSLMGELSRELARVTMTLAVHFDSGDGDALVEVAGNLHADAVVTLARLPKNVAERLLSMGVTLVPALGSDADRDHAGDVTTGLQVQHLHERGHTRIAFGDTHDAALATLAGARFDAVSRECAARGIAPPARGTLSLDPVRNGAVVREWFEAGVSGVCAFNDEVALAVLSGMHVAGLACPRDLAVVGTDDTTAASLSIPALTTVAFDVGKLAASYANRLLNVLRAGGAPPPPSQPGAWIVQRDST